MLNAINKMKLKDIYSDKNTSTDYTTLNNCKHQKYIKRQFLLTGGK